MTAIANIGSNFVVALPPSEIWLNDLQAAEYLGYKDVHFKAAVCCQPNFPKPRFVINCGQGRRWNLAEISNWLKERSDDEPKEDDHANGANLASLQFHCSSIVVNH